MKMTNVYLRRIIKEELRHVLSEMQSSPEETIRHLKEYFEQVREGIQLDVKKRSWSGQDRSEESAAINFFLQPDNLEKIASGVEIHLGKWHMLLEEWADGGIYNAGLREMPGYNIFHDYKKSIGGQAQAQAAVAYR